jgi:hypothetical protein
MDTVHIFPTKAVEKNKTHVLWQIYFSLSRTGYRDNQTRLKQKLTNVSELLRCA